MSEIKIDKSVLRVYKNFLVKKFFNEAFEIIEDQRSSYIKYINEILNIKYTTDIKDMIYSYINNKNDKYLEYRVSNNIDNFINYYNNYYNNVYYYNENDIMKGVYTSPNIQNNFLNETEIEEIKELSDKLNIDYYNRGIIGLIFCMIEDESKNYLIKNNFFNFLTDEINTILDIHHLYECNLNKINDFYNASDYVDNLCYKLRRYIKVIFDNKDIIHNFDKEKFYEDIKKIINHINNIRINLVKSYFMSKCSLSIYASKIYSYLSENICVHIFDEVLKDKYSKDFEYFNNFACKDFYNSFYSYLSESSSEIKDLFISEFLLNILYKNSNKEEKIYLIDTINEYCSDSEILQEVFKYSMENEEG